MYKFFFSFLIYLIFITYANAEIVNEINISGNKRVSDKTIVMFSGVVIGQDISEDSINEITKNIYETNFFKNISIDFKNQILQIDIEENPIVQTVEITGVKSKKYIEPLEELLTVKEKSSYLKTFVNSDLNKIKNFLKKSGFYFAVANVDIISNANNTVDLIYNVELGKKALIKKVKFTGDKIYKDKKLKSIIVTEENKFWKFLSNKKYLNQNQIELDTRLLKNFYLNNGYYESSIDSSSASNVDKNNFELVFNINAGKRFYFNDFDLVLPSDYDKNNFSRVYDKFEKLKGKVYSLNSVKKILDEIDLIAMSKQYEFINASIDEKILESNKLNLKFIIDESKKFYVNRINIIGNDITNEKAIRDLLVIDEGDPLNEILNNRSINNIKSSGLFKSVNYSINDDTDKLKKNIDIIVEEQPTGEISAGAGFGTSGQSFTIGIRENNFNGNNTKIDTSLKISTNTIQGGVNFSIPNYKYSDKALNINIFRRDTDLLSEAGYKNETTNFTFGTSFEQKQDLYFSPNINLEFETLSTNSTASNKLKKQDGDYYDINFGYSILYDQRNQSYQPSDGYFSQFRQVIPLISNKYTLSNTYDYKTYHKIANEFIGSFSFHFKTINSLDDSDVIISERINLSGSKLRGFESGKIGPKDNLDYIGGNYASAVTLATTLPNVLPSLQNVDFNLFLDMGNVWGVDYNDSLNINQIRSAAGIAVDLLTPIGPLNFVIAKPIAKANTDKTESFRFDLGTTF
jgi:outer membrane protein insertion porin family